MQDHNNGFHVGLCVLLLQGQCMCTLCTCVFSKAKEELVVFFLQQLILLLLLLSSDLVGQLCGNCP